jgi:hypothetical protein
MHACARGAGGGLGGGGALDSKVLSTYLNPQNFLKDNNVPFTQFKWRRRKRNKALSKGITQPLPPEIIPDKLQATWMSVQNIIPM